MNDGNLLLMAIAKHPGEMTPCLQYIDWAKDNPEVIRGLIASATMDIPNLIMNGNGLSSLTWYEDRKRLFQEGRASLLESIDAFAAAMAWLAGRAKRATVDTQVTSYSYKHMVERFVGVYVSNGSFIAAGVVSGFAYKTIWESVNVHFGISRRSLTDRGA